MKIGKSPVVVVAHPDDEVMWAAGIILRYWTVRWTVICCSIPRRDPVRAWLFFESCKRLDVSGQLIPSAETEPSEALMGLEAMGMLEDYDTIVTHNEWGEYGHVHHAQVHNYCSSVAGIRSFITFGYRRGGVLGREEIALNDLEYERKCSALKSYDHSLPYEGRDWPKWRALEHRYYEVEKINPRLYTYDVHTYDSGDKSLRDTETVAS